MSENEKKPSRFKAPFSFLKSNPVMWFWWFILLVSLLMEISYFIKSDYSFTKMAQAGKLDFGGLALTISSLVTMGIDFFYDGIKNIERKFKIINGTVVAAGFIILILALSLRDFSDTVPYQLAIGASGYVFSFIAFLCNFFPKNKEMTIFEDENYAEAANKAAQALAEKANELDDELFKSKEEQN